jgi:hypothetical protein
MNGHNRKRAHPHPDLPASFEISTHNPENLVAVENEGGRVIMRAAYGNFSPRRKSFLIRQLAAEGYIPDRFDQCSEFSMPSDLTWVVDRTLLEVGSAAIRRSRRFMGRLLLVSCFVWLAEISLVLLLRH